MTKTKFELAWPGFYYDKTDEDGPRHVTPSSNLVSFLTGLPPGNAEKMAYTAGAQAGVVAREAEGQEQLVSAATKAIIGGLTLDNIHGSRKVAESYMQGAIEALVAVRQPEEAII